MTVKVILHGYLAEQFGPEHEFAIRCPGEAILALDANFPSFRRVFMQCPEYYLRIDDEWRGDKESLLMPCARRVDFVPAVEGAFGAALVPLVASALAVNTLTASIIVAVVTTALMIGISLLLAPKPKKDTKDEKKEDSFIFSGSDATIGQGAPVPVVYGRCWVSPVVVSAGLETGDEKIENASGGGGANSPWSN